MPTSREDAERKIRALRALAAPGSGATDPERETALAMAEKMMAAHGLRDSDLDEKRPAPSPAPRPAAKRYADGVMIVVNISGKSFSAWEWDQTNRSTGSTNW